MVKTILQIKRIYSFGFQTPIMHLCLGSLCLVLSMVFSTGVDTDKMKNKMSSVCNLISQENVAFIQGSILGLFTYLSVHGSGLYVKVNMLYFSCFMNPHLHFSLFFLLEEYLPFYSINSLSISFCFYLMTRLLNFAFSIFPLLYHFFILNFILTTPSLEHYKNFHSRCTVSFIWPPSLYDNIILKISIHCLICSNTFA